MQDSGAVSAHPTGEFVSQYLPVESAYDEMVDWNGQLRPAWSQFVPRLAELGPNGLTQRGLQAQRLLRENGVTYNVYGASQELDRPWEVDPLPLMIGLGEWEQLAAGIEQRARLLNALMADVYGQQRLFRTGLLPASLLFQNPGFLRPCHSILPPGKLFLHLYAAQLARRSDGRWIVLSDRTQGPSGAGYTLENRLVVSRTLPQDFHQLHVVRLASFFIALRETLAALSQRHGDNPRIVILSPGTSSSRYFEDVSLARYLGYSLVEGGDLTVRRDGVFLKTLGGLLPVDIILRRLLDADCDPLDLRHDSPCGVTGLVQAVRYGQVLVANALGSGFLEAPVLHAFLPGVCRYLLSEDLLLPSVPTWWCGDAMDRSYVESQLDRLIIRPAFRHRNVRPVVGSQLSAAERQELLAEIRHRPEQFIAQEPVIGSTAPVWDGEKLRPWHLTLRSFAVASGNGYRVMPGGLSRVAPRPEMLAESMAAGQRSKDVWILADEPVENVSLLRPSMAALELRRSSNDLSSRAADHLYWLGRLMERAEAMVRHLRCIVVRMTSELQPAGLDELRLLVLALSENGESELLPLAAGADEEKMWEQIRSEVWEFLCDRNRNGSLLKTVQAAQATAAVVRDRISVDSWRIVRQLEFRVDGNDRDDLGQTLVPLNGLLAGISAFSGLCSDSMTRGPGWRFLDMGRRIERGLQILHLVRGTLVDGRTEILPRLEAMLEIADSSMTYRYRYLTTLQLPPVLDLVLSDETNPRAVAFQLAALAEHVRQLTLDRVQPLQTAEHQLILSAAAAVRLVDVEALSEIDPESHQRKELDQFQKRVALHLRELSDGITHTYLTHTTPSRQLGSLPTEPQGTGEEMWDATPSTSEAELEPQVKWGMG